MLMLLNPNVPQQMRLSGGSVWCHGSGCFEIRDILIDGQGIIGSSADGHRIDLSGLTVLPGFVDTHIHGFGGADTSDGDTDGIIHMARELVKRGVTSFCPTTMTMSYDRIYKAFDAVSEAMKILRNDSVPHARILGIHLEGPFLSPERTGVQGKDSLTSPDIEFIEQLEEKYPGLLKIIDIAPEIEGSRGFIDHFKDRYCLSIAHSNADYDTANNAFKNGVRSVTHVLNAMPPIDKRAPGIVCAAFDSDAYVELISDGIHVQSPVIRMIYKAVRPDRIVTISDSMRGAGMPDGTYRLGDTDVICKNGRTYYGEGGGLAGSVTDLMSEYRLLKSSGVDESMIIRSLSVNPCERIGFKGGEISDGYPADLVIFDGEEHVDTLAGGMSCQAYNML